MLNKAILKADLMFASADKEYPEIWDNIAQVIKDHIEQNGFAQATYLGSIPGTPPIPSVLNSSPHLFNISVNIQGAALALAGQGGLVSLVAGLSLELSKSMVSNCTTSMFTMSPAGPLIPVSIVFALTPEDDHDSTMTKLADAIVNAFLIALPVPPVLATPLPVVAADGSIGVLTFNSIT